jgi:hypothetical protein
LHQAQLDRGRLQREVYSLQSELQAKDSALHAKESELRQTVQSLQALEQSKVMKMRAVWLGLKRRLLTAGRHVGPAGRN